MKKDTFLSLLFLAFIICGCSNKQEPIAIFSGNAMTMDYRILVGASLTKQQIDTIQSLITNTFDEIDHTYNKWNPLSEVSFLNRLAANEHYPLSEGMYRLLQDTDRIVILSQGRFDPTIEPLQELWKNSLKNGKTPSNNEIESVKAVIGWNKIHFRDGIFSKKHNDIKLDLGGIAKGLCVDLLTERLNALGYRHVYIEWGGEIRASGRHPAGRPWTIFISRFGDKSPDQAIATLPLQDQSIATSGDYLQFWTLDDGTTYSHIIDPRTYQPILVTPHSIGSASVMAKKCAIADGLATAAMLFDSAEESERWLEQIKQEEPDLQFWIVSREEN